MNCIVENTFLWFRWKTVRHDYKLYSIRKFMDCSRTFNVERKCMVCGRIMENSFAEYDDLLLEGIPAEVLNKITTDYYYLPE